MPNVLIRDLPESVHARLRERAEERGQSLQQYLVVELVSLAHRPTVDEALARVSRRRGGRVGFHEAVSDIASERGRS
jgi:antitoxin FitA